MTQSNEKELVEELYKYGDAATFRQYGFVRWAGDHWLYHRPNKLKILIERKNGGFTMGLKGLHYKRAEMINLIRTYLDFKKEFPIEGGLV